MAKARVQLYGKQGYVVVDTTDAATTAAAAASAATAAATASSAGTSQQDYEGTVSRDKYALTTAQGAQRAVVDEEAARTAAILAEADARIADVDAEATARGDALLTQYNTVHAEITTETTLRQSADDSLAQSISTLAAGTGEQFDSQKVWYFDADLELWTGNGVPTVAGGYMRPANHATDPYVQSGTGMALDGDKYHYAKAKIKRTGTPAWVGELRGYAVGGTLLVTATIPEPTFDADGDATIDFKDVAWTGTVDRIRLDLSSVQDATNYFQIDWVAVGRPTPGASIAALQVVDEARITGDAAEATQRNTLATQMRGAYTGTDPAALASGLLYVERQARVTAESAQAGTNSTLQANIDDANTSLNSTVTRVATVEGRIDNTGAGKTLEVVASDVAAMGVSISDPTTGLAAKASNTEYQLTKTQVNTNTGEISAQSTQLNTVSATLGESPDNLIKKGQFTSDLSRGYWTGGNVQATANGTTGYCLRSNVSMYDQWGMFPCAPGDTFDLEMDVFTDEITAGYIVAGVHAQTAAGVNAFHYAVWDDLGGTGLTAASGNGWFHVKGVVTIPAGAAVKGRALVFALNAFTGYYYVNNMRLTKRTRGTVLNASATTLLDARVVITEDGLTIAQAAWGFQLDVNGKVASAYALNDGTAAVLEFNMDEVIFSSTSGSTSIRGGVIVQRAGGYMTANGPGFGASNDLLSWFGPDMPLANCTIANAVTYKSISGVIPPAPAASTTIDFYGSSSITTSPNTLSLVNNNTAGANKTVTARYYFQASPQNTTSTPGSGSATLSLWRKVGTGAFVQLGATQTVTMTDTVDPGSPGKWIHNLEGVGELIVTDTDTSLSNHTYEWRLTARTSTYAATTQTMSIRTVE